TGRIKVAFFARQNAEAEDIYGQFSESVTINGAPAGDPSNTCEGQPCFRIFYYSPDCCPTQPCNIASCITPPADQVTAWAPDVIVYSGLLENASRALPRIEATWPPSKPRPYHFFDQGALSPNDLLQSAVNMVEQTVPDLHKRCLGIFPTVDTPTPAYALYK